MSYSQTPYSADAYSTEFVDPHVQVFVTGVGATGSVGNVSVPNDAAVLTGLEASAQLGTLAGAGNVINIAFPSGVEATAEVGSVTLEFDFAYSASGTGIVGTGGIGNVSVDLLTPVNVTGVAGTGQIGTAIAVQIVRVTAQGVFAVGTAGPALVWGIIDDSQTADWEEIAS